MYKLIIGNVRITVSDDAISREQAATAARQAISIAQSQGKLLSHIEINAGETDLEVLPTEKSGNRSSRKTIKHSMLDGMQAAIHEKLYPVGSFSNKDSWFDSETGQEWNGGCVSDTRDEIMKAFEEWATSVK